MILALFFFNFIERTLKGRLGKTIHFTVCRKKYLLNKFWVVVLTPCLALMGASVVKNSNDDIMVMLQSLIYFSARVNKQSSSLKITIHFFSGKYFQFLFKDLEDEPKAGKCSFWVSPSLYPVLHHCLLSTPTAPPHANNTINMQLWKASRDPSKHTTNGNSLNSCTLALENQLVCAPSQHSLFAYSLSSPYGQS